MADSTNSSTLASRFATEALLRQSKAIREGSWLGTMSPIIPSSVQLQG